MRGDDEKLLLLDRQWRNVLHLFIEVLTRSPASELDTPRESACELDIARESDFKVKVAILEAVRRLGVQHEVTASSNCEDIDCAVRYALHFMFIISSVTDSEC